jgi:hypothetical protein
VFIVLLFLFLTVSSVDIGSKYLKSNNEIGVSPISFSPSLISPGKGNDAAN